jgi:hypothetical protein
MYILAHEVPVDSSEPIDKNRAHLWQRALLTLVDMILHTASHHKLKMKTPQKSAKSP